MSKACLLLFLAFNLSFAQNNPSQTERQQSGIIGTVKAVVQRAFVERPSGLPPEERGGVTIIHPALQLAASENMQVRDGDVIQTSGEGRIEIALRDGSILSFGSPTRLTLHALNEPRNRVVVELTVGNLVATVASDAIIEVRTKKSVVTSTPSSRFSVDASSPVETGVVCSLGEVNVRAVEREPLAASERQSLPVSDDAVKPQPTRSKQLETAEKDAGPRTSSTEVPDEVYALGQGITPPKLIYKVDSERPRELRNVKGTVTLQAIIDAKGKVRSVRVVRGLHPVLDEKAMEAVRQWVFSPGTKDGRPVAVQAGIEVAFY